MAVVFHWGLWVLDMESYDNIEYHDKASSDIDTQLWLQSLENGG